MKTTALVLAMLSMSVSGCATAKFYDQKGEELPGLPFVYKDHQGLPHLAYVKTTSGFGEATFSIDRNESGGYTKFSNNLDSTAAAQLTGDVVSKAFEAGRKAGRAELEARIRKLEDRTVRDALLRDLEDARE
jgi:hypothetical protein